MRIIRDLSGLPASCQHGVVALGNFDGVHLGHQAILNYARTLARTQHKPLAAMVFEPHPREFFNPAGPKLRIYPIRRKYELLRDAGIETLYALRFNDTLAKTNAAEFVSEILVRALAVDHVVTGYNFLFGHQRSGDKEFLNESAQRHGFQFTAHEPVCDALGTPVSSSRIREFLRAGDTASASTLLGRPYAICGRVRHGDKRGRQLGFPTANILAEGLFLPRFGVYAIAATLADGSRHHGVANLGLRPSFDTQAPRLEAHLFDFNGDLYNQHISVELIAHLRDEQKFSALAELTAQITRDSESARNLFSQKGLP